MYRENLATRQAALYEGRHARRKRRRILFFILVLILSVGFFYIIRKPFLRVNTVTVDGSTLVNANDVKQFVDQEIDGYQLFLIPRNSILFLKKEEIQSKILDNFPRLSKIEISSGNEMHITLFEPVFTNMYCALIPTSTAGPVLPKECALLHPDGKLGSVAPRYSYSPFFTFYKSAELLPGLGTTVVSRDEITRIALIKNEVESYGIPVIGFVYGAEYDELLLDTGASFEELPRIIILFGAKSEDVQKTLGVGLEDETVKKLLLDDLSQLKYIDLRFTGQVVYKKKS